MFVTEMEFTGAGMNLTRNMFKLEKCGKDRFLNMTATTKALAITDSFLCPEEDFKI